MRVIALRRELLRLPEEKRIEDWIDDGSTKGYSPRVRDLCAECPPISYPIVDHVAQTAPPAPVSFNVRKVLSLGLYPGLSTLLSKRESCCEEWFPRMFLEWE